MNYIYIVRHKTVYPDDKTKDSMQISEWAFFSKEGAEYHCIKHITGFLVGKDRLEKDDPRIGIDEDFKNQLKLSDDDYRSYAIPCNWTKDGERLVDDLIEVEKLIVRP